MALDVVDLRTFYAAPLGRIAQRFVARVVRAWWPNVTGMAVMGLGYAVPYLTQFGDEALRVLCFMPAEQGVLHWPSQAFTSTTLVESDSLPLPDGCIDRLLVVHLLEVSEHPRDVLAEIWRVLAPGGRMIAVAPNRRGWWARSDATPFGNGQPFSRRQLNLLLRETLFSPERFDEALYVPPFPRSVATRLAPAMEACGRQLALPGAGLHLVEVSKQLYRPIPLRRTVRQVVPRLEPMLVPGISHRAERAGLGDGAAPFARL